MALSGEGYMPVGRECRGLVFLEDILEGCSGFAHGAVRALMSALLFDGVQAFLNYSTATSSSQKSRYREAYNWVMLKGDEYIFSYENVCEGLGVDPEYLRNGLLGACDADMFEWKKIRRVS